jgi:hypothetical protein
MYVVFLDGNKYHFIITDICVWNFVADIEGGKEAEGV